MKLKDYINEHYIFEKTYDVKSLAKAAIKYYKLQPSLSPDEVFAHVGSLGQVLNVMLKDGDSFKAEQDVIDQNTGEMLVAKGETKSGSDIKAFKKKYKQTHRNVKDYGKKAERPMAPNLFNKSNVSDFESFYDIEYKSLSEIYPPEEAGVPQDEMDYDFSESVPVKVTRKDRWTMGTDDKKNLTRLVKVLKNTNKSLEFAGEMALGGKFYTIDVYLK